MSTYSVAQVETLTGIKAHTLRIWERRYEFLSPERTNTNIRFYSDKQLRKLLNIGILVQNGYRISKLDKMPDEQMFNLVSELLEQPREECKEDVQAMTICMLSFDETEFNRIYKRQIDHRGLLTTMTELIYPFLSHVGILWSTSKVIPAQEHFISNLIRQKLVVAIDSLPDPPTGAPGLLMFLPETEYHEVGLLLGNFIAKQLGWRVIYLGQNVPLDNISAVLNAFDPDALMTMFVAPNTNNTKKIMGELTKMTTKKILLAGSPVNLDHIEGNSQLKFIAQPQSLISYLEQVTAQRN